MTGMSKTEATSGLSDISHPTEVESIAVELQTLFMPCSQCIMLIVKQDKVEQVPSRAGSKLVEKLESVLPPEHFQARQAQLILSTWHLEYRIVLRVRLSSLQSAAPP